MILPDYPFRVEFEVNSSCNLKCKYCYAMPFMHFTPTFERLEFLFNKTMQEANPFEVVLVGGEPFMRQDFVEVLESATRIFGGTIGTSTNGTLLSKLPEDKLERLRVLAEGKVSLQVSLDSVVAEVNEKTRGCTTEVLAGLDALERHNVKFSVGIVLTTANAETVLGTAEYLLMRYSALSRINLEPLRPTFILGREYLGLKLDGEQMRSLYHGAKQLAAETNRADVKVEGVVEDCENSGKDKLLLDSYGLKPCYAGLLRAGVFSDGGVTPCLALRTARIGNLYEESWKEIWGRAKEGFGKVNMAGGQCAVNVLLRHGAPATAGHRLKVLSC